MHVKEGKHEQFIPEEESAFDETDTLFRGCVISVLAENLVDSYVLLPTGKELRDALEAQYGVSDAGSELYVMEQFLDYRMVEDCSVVEQSHEIHTMAKDLKNCSKESPCVLPDKFVTGGIISKLPPSWRDLATSQKHKRQTFTIDGLIGTLDVEEKARAKDICGKGVVGASSANFVQKNNSDKNKKKPPLNLSKAKQTITFKKKKGACYVCGSTDHFAAKCPEHKGKKSVASLEEHRGTVIHYL